MKHQYKSFNTAKYYAERLSETFGRAFIGKSILDCCVVLNLSELPNGYKKWMTYRNGKKISKST